MFVFEDYLEHDTFGPVLAKRMEREREEGLNAGRREGAWQLVQKCLAKRFGEVPESVLRHLSALSLASSRRLLSESSQRTSPRTC